MEDDQIDPALRMSSRLLIARERFLPRQFPQSGCHHLEPTRRVVLVGVTVAYPDQDEGSRLLLEDALDDVLGQAPLAEFARFVRVFLHPGNIGLIHVKGNNGQVQGNSCTQQGGPLWLSREPAVGGRRHRARLDGLVEAILIACFKRQVGNARTLEQGQHASAKGAVF